jgi:uncharacterized damage-inducible protein DinB
MAEHPMETTLRTALWRQFGAAIDMLENALLACPSTLWNRLLWSDPEAPAYPTFWSLTHHTLFWLDLYLTGSLEGFAPPTPFSQDEFGPARVLPEQSYTKEELHAYLVQLRQKCQTTLLSLSDEQAQRQVAFPWRWWKPMSFFELQLYTMRHVQEHAAQLSLFLGQHGIPGEALYWVGQAKDEAGRLSRADRKFGPTATDAEGKQRRAARKVGHRRNADSRILRSIWSLPLRLVHSLVP